jgi:hypothetical protein
VGIGGKTSNDLIQAGVYEIANSDGSTYQVWYELLPDDSVPVNLAVHPGDSISAAILETSPDIWNIVITNNTSKKQFEKTVQYQSSLSSAEWIQERPLIDGTLTPLSGYTPVTFTGATAIQNGMRVSLVQTGAQEINLIDAPSQLALSVPSPISTDGTSFSVSRTSATVTPADSAIATTIPSVQYMVPPYMLHRTGRTVTWTLPGITWSIHF